MGAYKILVANPYARRDDWDSFCDQLVDIFLPAIRESRDFDSCTAVHHTSDPWRRDFHLVLYMVPSRSESMIARRFNVTLPDGHAGYTYSIRERGNETISEVYYTVELNLARRPYLAYHEAMHNILRSGNGLHQRHGLAAHVPNPGGRRHANDVLMGRALVNTPRQWFGGFEAARETSSNLAQDLDGL